MLLCVLLAFVTFGAQQAKNPAPVIQNGSLPWVSPDGAHIAFISNRAGSDDLFVIAADGSGEVQLTKTAEDEHLAGWTRDGKQILFSIFNDGRSALYAIDLQGKKQRQIGVLEGRSAVVSPDGKRVVYWSGEWTSMRVFVAPLDGKAAARQINDGSSIAWMMRWSPDGTRIAFTGRSDPKSELAIFVVNADGSERRQLTHMPAEEGGAQGPAWSRDGRQIAIQVASRTRKGTSNIWIVDVATGEGRKLAAHDQVYLDETPSWFPDGRRLAFQSNRSGRMEVWTMDADGTNAKQITGIKSTSSDDSTLRRYQQSITPASLAARLHFFASDLLEGRETTARGQKLAASYLASIYAELGLEPNGTDKTSDPLSPFLQPFTVYKRSPQQSRLEVTVNGNRLASSTFSSTTHDDLSYFFTGGFSPASGGVVFAGKGRAEDYAELSEKGIIFGDKWLLVLDETKFINKRSALWKTSKPKGVLVVADLNPNATTTFADRAAQASLDLKQLGNLSLVQSSDFPPTFAISTKLANQLLAPSRQTVQGLAAAPTVFQLDKGVQVSATIDQSPALRTENVLAFIEGSDPQLKQEVVIISSHYDHLGINPALKGDQIFNGAADDGSGVVASLELAQSFMKAKRDGFGPRRSILFINFSGEEKGLLGSTYYSQQPVVPWERTVADINMDGVGGFDLKHPTNSRNYIYILGREDLSNDLIRLTTRMNQMLGLNLDLTPNQGFNSDQQNFEAQFIPYVYYSTGLTKKYHQTGDEPNTIDYNHLARVVQLIFATAWQVANQDTRIPSINRTQLMLVGYTCRPCPFACDDRVYDHPGECPVCGMALMPKYKR